MKFLNKDFLLHIIFSFFVSLNLVSAEEIIQTYHSDIRVLENSDMLVKETIVVQSEQNKIKRGIYRDFPLNYKDHLGNRYKVGFEIINVQRNGKSENYHTKNTSKGIRIYIGNKNITIPKGIHKYEITYKTSRQLGYFDEYDEFYWNVTGNEWDFPVNKASATVRLPKQIPKDMINLEAYTGAFGSKEKNYKTRFNDDGAAHFETTQPLPKRHGLTIVVAWPKGYFIEPTASEKMKFALQDNRHLAIALIGLVFLLAFYGFTWLKVGKDPEKGIIIPQYESPSGYSPASMRYVLKMGYDKMCFTAAIINLAVKGYLKIEEEDGDYSLMLTGNENIEMAPGESTIIKKLFGEDAAMNLLVNSPLMKIIIDRMGGMPIETDAFGKINKIKLTQSNHNRIGRALKAHQSSLENNHEKIYFLTNTSCFVIGILITFILLITSILTQPASVEPAALFMLVWLTGWTFGVFFLIKRVYHAWSNINNIISIFPAIFLTAFAVPFIAGEIFGLVTFAQLTSFSMIFILLVAAIINWIFYELLKAPTLAGRELLDKIEGFKQYINVTEKHDLKYKYSGGKTPELFERILPFAIALDFEQTWGEQFEDVLSDATSADSGYSPGWYHGSN
ncbi:MAG: DUF2207 domain-containing protein [Proteobacteria bacterium]|nr:DUF2207 domain-containing protein [Pseudomonadota bacterium]